MAYDTLSPYAGAYPQTQEELDAQNALTRDVGVGGLRALTRLTGIADIPTAGEWLGRESGGIQALSSVLPHLDRLDDSDASYLHNLYLRSMGARGDPESQEKAKKVINPLRGEFHNRVEDIIDTILPFETTERSEIIELGATLMGLGLGIQQIGAMIWRNRKNIPLLLDKMKNAIRKKQDPKAVDEIVPKASLQISDKRIDKTVERAMAEEKVKPKPAKTKPKTEKEFDQKWTQKKDEFQSKYDQDVEAIYASAPAGKITPEKIERVEALTKKLKKRIDKVYVEMDKDFAYLEKQAKIKYAADRKKLKEAEESISVGEIPEEIIEKLLDKRLLKTGPKHFQGTKEYTAWKIDKNIAYTRSMLVDEADKLYKWYNKTLDSLYKANDKAGDEILAGAIAKIKKTKGGTLKEQKARIKDIEAQFKVELDKVYMERELQRKEIEAIYAKGKEKLEKASVSLQETLKKEQADLAAGKITRHSRGGLVENKVNYALNQWK